MRGPCKRLDDLLDPDFQEIGACGRLWTPSEMISALLDSDHPDEPIEAEGFNVAAAGPGLL